MRDNLSKSLQQVTDQLIQNLRAFSEAEINQRGVSEGWTAGQIVRHLILSDQLILQTLLQVGMPSERRFDQEVSQLKNVFLDFDKKYSSPEQIVPENVVYDARSLEDTLNAGRDKMLVIVREFDLQATCNNPILGELTRFELLHFVLYHSERHLRQLHNLRTALRDLHDKEK